MHAQIESVVASHESVRVLAALRRKKLQRIHRRPVAHGKRSRCRRIFVCAAQLLAHLAYAANDRTRGFATELGGKRSMGGPRLLLAQESAVEQTVTGLTALEGEQMK